MFALRTAADAAAAAETAGVEAAAEQARLGVESQRRVSRADLQLAVESCAYYANKGDVQTALTAALLLRRFIRISEWRAIKGWFIDYIDQLDQHQEHAVATDIILACPFPDVPDQLNDRVTIALSCIICGVKLDCHPDAGFAWCNECKHAANSCVVCQMPVQGRYIWCKGCGHGGHAEHIREWFEELGQRSCPSGCGHSCQLDPVD
ncbi:SEA (Seh1-associated) complex subunit [Coemansia nantahalensis]|nr:SEA (Seh1-associated) complex subunit [Coemansia nantahalensis]